MYPLIKNLVSDASRYTPDNGTITIKLTETSNNVTLIVGDTGVGISDLDEQKLFHRFSRIKNELSTLRGGSGIGVYLVKRITDLHKFKISVKSVPGKGSKFTVTIPRGK